MDDTRSKNGYKKSHDKSRLLHPQAACKLSIYNFSDRAVGQTILLRQRVDGNTFSVKSSYFLIPFLIESA